MDRRPLLITAVLLATVLPAAANDYFPDQTVGPISVEGNTSTRTDLILKELPLREGDPLDYDLVDAAWEHLEDLGWFAFVDISLDDSEDVVPVRVLVEEDRTFRGYPIIDYDMRWDVLLGLRLYDINLGGRGERFSVSGIWHRPHRYEISWEHPWTFGVRGLAFGLEGRWEDAPFVHRDFDFRAWNGAAYARWDFAEPFYATLRGGVGSFEQDGEFVGGPLTWAAGERDHRSLALTLGLDNRDLDWYPTRGGHHRLNVVRHTGDGFDAFTELSGDLRQFVSLPWDHIIAVHARGRRVDGSVPPERMLYWGGPETLRGHDYGAFEGEEGWLLSAEYRWPIFLMPISPDGRVIGIGLHAFYDRGATWWDGGAASPRDDYGMGAHVNISDHQFRFEVARTDDDRTAFQFMDAFNF